LILIYDAIIGSGATIRVSYTVSVSAGAAASSFVGNHTVGHHARKLARNALGGVTHIRIGIGEVLIMVQGSDSNTQAHRIGNEQLLDQYEHAGFAGRVGFGKRPAVIVIDMGRAWLDTACPIGSDLSAVLDNIVRLLDVARCAGIPVFFTTMAYDPELVEVGRNVMAKVSHVSWLIRGSEWVQLSPALGRRADEPLIEKQRGSAFFGPTLMSQLVSRGIDTTVIVGCSTSGCIRATATDAHDENFRVIVPAEAVGDRSASAHAANLFDIDARYGDVMPLDAVIAELKRYVNGERIVTTGE
jgi:nicotinamidase-related amidase